MICGHCKEPVVWDSYWTTWEHKSRSDTLTAELCMPAMGFEKSTHAAPSFGEQP